MGFNKVVKDDSSNQLFSNNSQPRLEIPKKTIVATAYNPKSKFQKLGKAEDVFTKDEIEGKEVSQTDYRNWVLPTARGYILEPLNEIEKIYLSYPATPVSARILRMTGHIRFLRRKLDDAGISYGSNDAILSEAAINFLPGMDDEAWYKEQDEKFKRSLNGNKVTEVPQEEIPDEVLLAQVEVFDHTGEDDEEDEE